MRPDHKKAEGFLTTYGISAKGLSTADFCSCFLEEMRSGLQGDSSSLKMIPTFIEVKEQIPYDTDVVVIDAGGTNLRTAVVNFSETEGLRISDFRKRGMPGVAHEVSSQEFFAEFADAVEPVFNRSGHIGFCFSYAAEITPDRDGRLIVFSKEIKAPEVIGKRVGEQLLLEMGRRGHTGHKQLTLLNDTVATLLASKSSSDHSSYSGYIGFILGTGTNTSYTEQNSRITKLSGLPSGGSQIINVESGNFDVPASPLDLEFFAGTKDPDVYHFEKLISGAYLGSYGYLVLRKAMEEKLFSPSFCERFSNTVHDLNTIEMDSFLHTPLDLKNPIAAACATDEDALTAYRLLDGVIERAAKLTAVNLAATVIQSEAGTDPRRPVCINADGTTYYKTHNLRRYTEWYLKEYLEDEMKRYYEFVTVDQSPIIGAAIAGLLY